MNLTDPKFSRFSLVKEMLETPALVGSMEWNRAAAVSRRIMELGRLFLTGEGSSRIFPAKNLICEILCQGIEVATATDGGRQASEYPLHDAVIFGASNSGRTKELVTLFRKLTDEGHRDRYGLTAASNSVLAESCEECFVLRCGKENAVAATKSVVEQVLFYRSLLIPFEGEATSETEGGSPMVQNQVAAAKACEAVLTTDLCPELVKRIAAAGTICFAGRNNGVGEELTLKTNEITRKKSDFFEGTYSLHGVEEVLDATDVIVFIEPFEGDLDSIRKNLLEGVGMGVCAIATKEIPEIPTIVIPSIAGYDTVLQLLAGWNLLVHVGVELGIDLDHPVRARKVGNEVGA